MRLAQILFVKVLAPAQCQYDVVLLEYPINCGISTVRTVGIGWNRHGAVVGYYKCPLWEHQEGFLWTPQDGFTTLPRPAGVTSLGVADINDAGVIVGWYVKSGVGFRGYVYEDGEYTEIEPLPGGAWSTVSAINTAGTFTGYRSIGSKGEPVFPYNAFVWSRDDGFIDLGVMDGPVSSGSDISDENGSPTGDGLSWQTAFQFLQDALDEAAFNAGEFNTFQIWVAATVPTNPYRPDRDDTNPDGTLDPEATFNLSNFVEVYGGFAGTEDFLAERDPELNVTVLSGDFQAGAPEGSCPNPDGGDCFTATPEIPGCQEQACCETVCAANPLCCETGQGQGWTDQCIDLANAPGCMTPPITAVYHVVTANSVDDSARLDGHQLHSLAECQWADRRPHRAGELQLHPGRVRGHWEHRPGSLLRGRSQSRRGRLGNAR